MFFPGLRDQSYQTGGQGKDGEEKSHLRTRRTRTTLKSFTLSLRLVTSGFGL
jgi:hypothetical protein